MNRVSSFLQLAEAAKGNADLPAGADPYEDFDFSPYLSAEQTEEDLRKTWRVFTKVKVRCSDAFYRMEILSSSLLNIVAIGESGPSVWRPLESAVPP